MQANDISKCIQKVIFDHTLAANERNQFARDQNMMVNIRDDVLDFIVSRFHLFYMIVSLFCGQFMPHLYNT